MTNQQIAIQAMTMGYGAKIENGRWDSGWTTKRVIVWLRNRKVSVMEVVNELALPRSIVYAHYDSVAIYGSDS